MYCMINTASTVFHSTLPDAHPTCHSLRSLLISERGASKMANNARAEELRRELDELRGQRTEVRRGAARRAPPPFITSCYVMLCYVYVFFFLCESHDGMDGGFSKLCFLMQSAHDRAPAQRIWTHALSLCTCIRTRSIP